MRGKLIASILILLQLNPLPLLSQGGVYVQIEPREPCIAGFPCKINISISNSDGTILLHKLKLITPWGAFVRDLGLREMRAGESLKVYVVVNVSIDSLEGPNFMRPELIYFVKGDIGMKSSQGNSSAILIQRSRIAVSLLSSPLSYQISLGEPLILEGSFRVDGIPSDFYPTLRVYVDGALAIEKEMNSSSGLFSIQVPLAKPGIHEVNLSLCYLIGCESKAFSVLVREAPKEQLSMELNSTKGYFQDLLNYYRTAVNDSIPIPGYVLSNISAIDSLIREAEAILSGNMTGDEQRVRDLLNRARGFISLSMKEITRAYKEALLSKLDNLRNELDSISKIDEKTYRNLSVSLDELEDRIASISPDNASKTYWDVTNRMEEMKKIVDSKRESLMSDIAKLSLVLITLLLISIVSITMLILRVWRGETGRG
ncbi:hypothetical protein [Candidatus Korarchaeum cryptofilum]|jgi:hypothetical protein|uniref:Uncharacterized protein n=1 Tax=Korarchaeum cryptofilum (strain OPF8) TaxID=374847 RepID=B1L732_KORCO|nr:hypothetical protein [Candidatus Korarchaeum cryptofilum]ACB08261.1 hypothetical protein Kcr_1515 [Candidatus Korarchaeum cryptofilum OPF8]